MTTALQTTTTQKASVLAAMATRFGTDPAALMRTLKSTVVPNGASDEQIAAFLIVANQHGLNPFTREIYAFPDKGGGIRPIVGIDGWLRMANDHDQFDGLETKTVFDEQTGELAAVECAVHRKDRRHPVRVTEFLAECRRNTEPWKQHPARMLRHKAIIQALRVAFSFSGIEDEDDASAAVANIAASPAPYSGKKVDALAAKLAPPEPPSDQSNADLDAELLAKEAKA